MVEIMRVRRSGGVPRLFGLDGDSWMRHANPASVWTRFAALPLLVASVWSRAWIGWWCVVPVVLAVIWLGINPLFFAPPASTKHWASKAVLGERIWVENPRSALPVVFRSRVPALAQCYQALGLVPLVYGLVVFDAVAAVTGVLIVEGGKLWYLDRMVLLFEELKSRPEYEAWDY